MDNQLESEKLLSDNLAGNEPAQEKFFLKLSERFLHLIKRKVMGDPRLARRVHCAKIGPEICEKAIAKIKRICPLTDSGWSLKRAINVFHNVVDDHIANSLTELAKKGDSEAENMLFEIIRKKLIERVAFKRWRTQNYERENK